MFYRDPKKHLSRLAGARPVIEEVDGDLMLITFTNQGCSWANVFQFLPAERAWALRSAGVVTVVRQMFALRVEESKHRADEMIDGTCG